MLKEIARLFNEENEMELTILADEESDEFRILMFTRNVVTNRYSQIEDMFEFEGTLEHSIKHGYELTYIDPFELNELALADNPNYLFKHERLFNHLYLYALRNRSLLGDYDSLEELRRIHETLLLAKAEEKEGNGNA